MGEFYESPCKVNPNDTFNWSPASCRNLDLVSLGAKNLPVRKKSVFYSAGWVHGRLHRNHLQRRSAGVLDLVH